MPLSAVCTFIWIVASPSDTSLVLFFSFVLIIQLYCIINWKEKCFFPRLKYRQFCFVRVYLPTVNCVGGDYAIRLQRKLNFNEPIGMRHSNANGHDTWIIYIFNGQTKINDFILHGLSHATEWLKSLHHLTALLYVYKTHTQIYSIQIYPKLGQKFYSDKCR